MSSILDALKKLENEKEEREHTGGGLNWPQTVNTKGALYTSLMSRTISYRPMVLGAIALAAVSFGTWFFLTRGPQSEPVKTVAEETVSKPMPIPEKMPPRVDPVPEKTISGSVDAPENPLSSSAYGPKKRVPRPILDPDNMLMIPRSFDPPERAESRTARSQEKRHHPWEYDSATNPAEPILNNKSFKPTSARQRERSRRSGAQHMADRPGPKTEAPGKVFDESEIEALSEIMPRNIPREQPDLKALWDARIEKHERSVQATMPRETEQPEPETAGLDNEMKELLTRVPKEMLPPQQVVEGGWLKLHAISYAEDPARRIAVINSKLVKEGGRIDGAQVSRIERDYVVIKKNGEEMMLPFGNH